MIRLLYLGMLLLTAPAAAQPAADTIDTEAERRVRDIIAADGVHVVHFWSPWCENSISEFRNGWFELIENNGDATFTFVTVWNDGDVDSEVLERFVIPDRVTTLGLPDHGPSAVESNRRRAFLGLPLTWTPSTWIYHRNGELAFMMNYGEMGMEGIQQLIDITRQSWDH